MKRLALISILFTLQFGTANAETAVARASNNSIPPVASVAPVPTAPATPAPAAIESMAFTKAALAAVQTELADSSKPAAQFVTSVLKNSIDGRNPNPVIIDTQIVEVNFDESVSSHQKAGEPLYHFVTHERTYLVFPRYHAGYHHGYSTQPAAQISVTCEQTTTTTDDLNPQTDALVCTIGKFSDPKPNL